jgi:uncharacterized protein YukE
MPGVTQAQDLASAVPDVPGLADIEVDPAKILDAAKVVEDQANALEDKLRTRLDELRIDTPAGDLVSTNTFMAWNLMVSDAPDSYAKGVRAYLRGLRDLVQQLRSASEQYKATDEDKAAMLGDRGGKP